MVWGAIFANGKSQLAILEGNQTAESYIRTLNDFLVPLIPEGRRGTIVYQQDNATIHKAHLTKMWLLYQNIKIIDWPAHSPDLNLIECLGSVGVAWRGVAWRGVYAHVCMSSVPLIN